MVLGVASITVAGCGGNSRYASPIVDMRGVDPVKYNNDVGECTEYKRQLPVYAMVERSVDAWLSAATR
jgi:hypothetical protein